MPSSFAITARMKRLFFDTEKVIKSIDRDERRALMRIGSAIRRTARSSIRQRKRKPKRATGRGRKGKSASSPGDPPLSWTREQPNLRSIFFVFEPSTKSVRVGPQAFRRKHKASEQYVPDLLEFGGTQTLEEYQLVAGGDWVRWKPRRSEPKATRTVQAHYRARPFMGPALEKNQELILDSFSKVR